MSALPYCRRGKPSVRQVAVCECCLAPSTTSPMYWHKDLRVVLCSDCTDRVPESFRFHREAQLRAGPACVDLAGKAI